MKAEEGINAKLVADVKKQLEMGKKKVVFSCAVPKERHQVAVIVDAETKQITVIDSEGKDQGYNEIKKLFESFSYEVLSKKPVVKQGEEDQSLCGVHVFLNIAEAIGEINDRKNENMDEWLRKILRAADAEERSYSEREDHRILLQKLINKLEELAPSFSNVEKSRDIFDLLQFLKGDFIKSPALSLNEFKINFQKGYEKFSEIEITKGLLKQLYSLVELKLDAEKAKVAIERFLALMTMPQAENDYFEKVKPEDKARFLLDYEMSKLIEDGINDILNEKRSIADKKAWLSKALLSSNGVVAQIIEEN